MLKFFSHFFSSSDCVSHLLHCTTSVFRKEYALSIEIKELIFQEFFTKDMMPLSRTLLSYGILLTCLNHANCFQGTPDPNQRFFGKSVREQESLEKFTIKDDLRFSPDIRFESDLQLPSLSESIGFGHDLKIPPRLAFVPRKLIGIDENPSEYWFDNKIHTFGNTRFFGGESHVSSTFVANWT